MLTLKLPSLLVTVGVGARHQPRLELGAPIFWGFTPLEWLALVEHELLLFAGFFFLIGTLDELAVDGVWAWLKLTGKARRVAVVRSEVTGRPLKGKAG